MERRLASALLLDISSDIVHRVDVESGQHIELDHIRGRFHMSFSPDRRSILDVVGHRTLWRSPLEPGEASEIFAMPEADTRLDYPTWSPDGNWVAFDRVQPSGGDIWLLDGLAP